MKHPNKSDQNGRRKSALKRLRLQLEIGTKNTNDGVKELTESDRKRINREIDTLTTKI